MPAIVTAWSLPQPPTQEALIRLMHDEGLSPYLWANAGGELYSAHSHPFDKVMYCVSGSITFGIPDEHRSFTIHAGDRLELPASVIHDAIVGPDGVLCLEAHV